MRALRWARIAGHLRALRRCRKGASAAEFAIIVPVLGVIFTGTMDFAQFANQGLVLDAALRAGGAYAMACNPSDTYDCTTLISDAVKNYATSLGSSVTVDFGSNVTSATNPQYCSWDNDTAAVVTCDNSAAACDATQAQCPKHFYVKIQAVWTLPAPLMQMSTAVLPSTLTRTLTVRVL